MPINLVTTRPNNRATNLIKALSSLNGQVHDLTVHHQPLIEIEGYQDVEFFTQYSIQYQSNAENSAERKPFPAQAHLNFDGVIFISGNAVDWAKQTFPRDVWQQLLANPLYAIGEQTASVLTAEATLQNSELKNSLSPQVKHPRQMNSEGLLALEELHEVNGQHWLIVKGLGGRQTLKTTLQARGARVSECSVYQRMQPRLQAQQRIKELHSENTVWLITSLEALINLSQILNQRVQDCRIIISSDRIAQRASHLGFNIVAQADNASDKQLVNCVSNWISKHR